VLQLVEQELHRVGDAHRHHYWESLTFAAEDRAAVAPAFRAMLAARIAAAEQALDAGDDVAILQGLQTYIQQ